MDKERMFSIKQEELDNLYRKYKPQLMQFVTATIKNRNLAEDIVHETFYEAIRKYDTFSAHPKPIAWLYTVAKFKIRECMRKLEPLDELYVEDEQEDSGGPEEGYSKAELELVISQVLTEDELLRFRRYYIWGESTAEIAQKEQISENNMRVRLSRLKQKIMNAIHQG